MAIADVSQGLEEAAPTSPERHRTIVVERDVECRTRTGHVLRADVYRPAEGRHPVLVLRTPYGKDFLHIMAPVLQPVIAAEAGYAGVHQDVRGRFTSDGGVFDPLRVEYDDGADAVAWAAAQPWSNGVVGAFGLSYQGATSWQMAASGAPALRAFMAAQSPGDFFHRTFVRSGVPQLGALVRWFLWAAAPDILRRNARDAAELREEFTRLLDDNDRFDAWCRHLPLAEFPPLSGHADLFASFYEILRHTSSRDEYMQSLAVPPTYRDIRAPGLVVGGWNDVIVGSDLEHWRRIRTEAATEEAREQSKLVIGPWVHGMFRNVIGQLDYGFRATGVLDLAGGDIGSTSLMGEFSWFQRRWFDHHLKGVANGVGDEPRVRIFVMGRNRWRGEDDWPLARARTRPWYLGADGVLSPSAPTTGESPDAYVYDPQDPCPTVGGTLLMTDAYGKGSLDQSAIMRRRDVLVYRSAPLEREVEVTGPVSMVLYASTSGRDTDWAVKLCDVHPDGRTFNICDGIARARFRNSDTSPELVEPGAVERYEVDLWATSNVFLPGHRIAVLLTSSDFPRYDRNLNTGELGVTSAISEAALQRIFHDAQRASHILLPIVEG
jgi:uncharacterized protein